MIGDPVAKRKFVVTDIHGCAKTFRALLKKVAFTQGDELFVLGDIVNKGPASREAIDLVLELQKDHRVVVLKGNHEQVVLDQIDRKKFSKRFKQIGGIETLKSFGVKQVNDLPGKYLQFLKQCRLCLEEDKYILVHAGLDFKQKDPLKAHPSQYKIRNWYKDIDYKWLGNRIILHGHTPVTKHRVQFQASNIHVNQYLDLDAGCVYHKKKGMGKLAIFEMESQTITFQKNIDL